MQKIIIIGSPGTGKSTLAKLLAGKLGLPLYHLDQLYWQENWQTVSSEEFIKVQEAIFQQDRWMIDGNYLSTMELRLIQADTVIFLDYPSHLAVGGILKRYITRHHKARSDMGGNNIEHWDWNFLNYTWKFNQDQRPKVLQLLKQYPDKHYLIFKNKRQLNTWLKNGNQL